MTTRSIEPLVIGGMVVVLGIVTLFADANGGLIPGGGPTKSDCYVELSVDGITNPSERVQKSKEVLITDGDVGDQGPCGDNKCMVSVGACINQHDPNLPDCTPPASLDKLTVKGAFTVNVPQLLTGSACGAFATVEVDAKVKRDKDGNIKKASAGKAKLHLKAKGPSGTKPRTDNDMVTIACVPRTVSCSPSGAFID